MDTRGRRVVETTTSAAFVVPPTPPSSASKSTGRRSPSPETSTEYFPLGKRRFPSTVTRTRACSSSPMGKIVTSPMISRSGSPMKRNRITRGTFFSLETAAAVAVHSPRGMSMVEGGLCPRVHGSRRGYQVYRNVSQVRGCPGRTLVRKTVSFMAMDRSCGHPLGEFRLVKSVKLDSIENVGVFVKDLKSARQFYTRKVGLVLR